MSKEQAVALHKSGCSCAQSIAKAFNASDELISKTASCGGGRAEGGLCGALYAGIEMAETMEAKQALKEYFLNKAKFETCRDIRKNKVIPCSECVKTVAEFLEK